MKPIDPEMAAEDFECPICERGTVTVRHRHVIRCKWIAECSHCGIQGEFWDPFEPRRYFEELAEYFKVDLNILRGK
jgi:hypothetical protein